MSIPPFNIEELTAEFLVELTRIHAEWVHEETNGEYGNDSNWFEGRRLTTFSIIEHYLKECKEKSRCLRLPSCCCEYLLEITVQDLKKYKAYFSWVQNGKKKDNPYHIEQAEYLEGCSNLMEFCTSLSKKNNKCGYDDLLAIIDRRNGRDRRKNGGGKKQEKLIIRGMDRRVIDHRGPASKHLPD